MTIFGLDFDLNTVLVTAVISALVYAVGSAITYAVIYFMAKGGMKSGDDILPPETHNGAEEVEKGGIVPDTQTGEDAGQVSQSEDSEEGGGDGDGDERGDENGGREEREGGEGGEEHQQEQYVHDSNEDGQIVQLTISDGQLAVATIEKTVYYLCWKEAGVIFYKLNDDEKINKKAIYNHEAVIDPFCEKTPDSVEGDKAKSVETKEKGELDSDYKVLKKALVKFK